MKLHIVLTLFFNSFTNVIYPQGCWLKITDPQNPISQYTTIFNYVYALFFDIHKNNSGGVNSMPRILQV